MLVQVGDRVKQGQVLFSDKKTPGVLYTSPACGEVVAVNRGAKRALESVVIRAAGDDAETFPQYAESQLVGLGPSEVRDNLVRSGRRFRWGLEMFLRRQTGVPFVGVSRDPCRKRAYSA